MKRKIDYKFYIEALEFSILFSALLSIKDVYDQGLAVKIFLLVLLLDYARRIVIRLKKAYDIVRILFEKEK